MKLFSKLLMLSNIIILGAFTKSFYNLIIKNTQVAAISDQIYGQILLIDLYQADVLLFITILISRNLNN